MGLEKLNPFKKSSSKKAAKAESKTEPSAGKDSNLLSPNDNIAPTKSTSSIANSLRSFGDKAEEFIQNGERPREVFKRDGKVDASRLYPSISTGRSSGLAPSTSASVM